MDSRYVPEAIQVVRDAVEADKNGHYRIALSKYKQALDLFIKGLEDESNPDTKQVVAELLDQYINRAEELKLRLAAEVENNDQGDNGITVSVEPSHLSTEYASTYFTRPNVLWSQVAGMKTVKHQLHENVVLPLQLPDVFADKKRNSRGVLLFGVHGVGKFLIAEACATEATCEFCVLDCSDLVKNLQSGKKHVQRVFRCLEPGKPTTIVLKNLEELCEGSYSSIKDELLSQMQERLAATYDGIAVIATTSAPWLLDASLLRRFKRRILVPMPGGEQRKQLVRLSLQYAHSSLSNEDIALIATQSEGFNCREVGRLCDLAIRAPLRLNYTANHYQKVDDKFQAVTPQKDGRLPANCVRRSLLDIESHKLLINPVQLSHFTEALSLVDKKISEQQIQLVWDWHQENNRTGIRDVNLMNRDKEQAKATS